MASLSYLAPLEAKISWVFMEPEAIALQNAAETRSRLCRKNAP